MGGWSWRRGVVRFPAGLWYLHSLSFRDLPEPIDSSMYIRSKPEQTTTSQTQHLTIGHLTYPQGESQSATLNQPEVIMTAQYRRRSVIGWDSPRRWVGNFGRSFMICGSRFDNQGGWCKSTWSRFAVFNMNWRYGRDVMEYQPFLLEFFALLRERKNLSVLLHSEM